MLTLKRPWCWARLKVGREGDNREWDGWMASPTQRTWVWASSGRRWRTEKPVVLQFMGSQKDTTEQLNTKSNRLMHCEGCLINWHLCVCVCACVCVCVCVDQSCLTLWGPLDCSPWDSSVHGILQARILEWGCYLSPSDLPDCMAGGFFTVREALKSPRRVQTLGECLQRQRCKLIFFLIGKELKF